MKPIIFHFEVGQVVKERSETDLKLLGMNPIVFLGGGKLFTVIDRRKSNGFYLLVLKNEQSENLLYWNENRFIPEWYDKNGLGLPKQKFTIGVSKIDGQTKHAAYYDTGVVDKEHIEGAKYAFMKKYEMKTLDGIEHIVIEGLKRAPDGYIIEPASKVEKAILEGSGHPSRFAITLLMAYRDHL